MDKLTARATKILQKNADLITKTGPEFDAEITKNELELNLIELDLCTLIRQMDRLKTKKAKVMANKTALVHNRHSTLTNIRELNESSENVVDVVAYTLLLDLECLVVFDVLDIISSYIRFSFKASVDLKYSFSDGLLSDVVVFQTPGNFDTFTLSCPKQGDVFIPTLTIQGSNNPSYEVLCKVVGHYHDNIYLYPTLTLPCVYKPASGVSVISVKTLQRQLVFDPEKDASVLTLVLSIQSVGPSIK